MNQAFVAELRKLPARLTDMRRHSGRSRLSIMAQYLRERRKSGIEFHDFHNAEFDTAPAEFRQNYLCSREQMKILALLNPFKYFSLARNKYLAHMFLDQVGVATAPLLLYYDPQASAPTATMATTADQAQAMLAARGATEFIYKPTESFSGRGVGKVTGVCSSPCNNVYLDHNNQQIAAADIFGDHPMLVEGVVRQTRQMAQLNPSSVNTIRMNTLLWPDGHVEIYNTYLRVGVQGSVIDNIGKDDNVCVTLDPATGRTRRALQVVGYPRSVTIERHPQSGVDLAGLSIENWESVVETVKGWQARIPFLKALGWDIALTDQGPVAIEINDRWDHGVQTLAQTGFRQPYVECYRAWGGKGL